MKSYILNTPKVTKESVSSFKGIDLRPKESPYSLRATSGITSKLLPALSSSKDFELVRKVEGATKIFSSGRYIGYVADGEVYLNGEYLDFPVSSEDPNFTVMLGQTIAFPDKQTAEYSLEADVALTATVSLCRSDGEDYDIEPLCGPSQPVSVQDGDLWIDTSLQEHRLKIYSNGSYRTVEDPYIKLTADRVAEAFFEDDVVTVSGILEGSYKVKYVGDGYIILSGIIQKTETGFVTIKRSIPDIHFAFTHLNRLFGCNKEGSAIYASAPGKPTCFSLFEGLTSDSYAVAVSDGDEFTAAAVFSGVGYFFKEKRIITLRGNKPQNFTTTEKICPGVKAGCHNSICEYMGNLIYYSPDGFMLFDGSYPQKLFEGFTTSLERVSAVVDKDTLYFTDGENVYSGNLIYGEVTLYKKFKNKGIAFTDRLYLLGEEGIFREGESASSFYIEFNPFGKSNTEKDYLSRIDLFVNLEGSLSMKIAYDEGEKRTVYSHTGFLRGEINIPVLLRRHGTLKLILEGRGNFTLYAMSLYRRELWHR